MLEQGRTRQRKEFNGIYRGVVVNNVDEYANGRCQVKIYPMFDGVEDEHLPWAIYGGEMGGGFDQVGTLTVPQIGAHVWCFFEAGDWMQPVYFASAPHMLADDPDKPAQSKLTAQSPTLALQDDGTHEAIDEALEKGVETADGGTWDEPKSSYDPEYPKNKVLRTENGFVIEIDDSKGVARYHIYHPSGTRYEIDGEGNVVVHNVGDTYTVKLGDDNIKVGGDCNITVTGNANIKATAVKINSDDIHIANQGEAAHPAVHGDTLTTYLDSLCAAIDSHTHVGNLGAPTSPPTGPMPKEESGSHSATTKID